MEPFHQFHSEYVKTLFDGANIVMIGGSRDLPGYLLGAYSYFSTAKITLSSLSVLFPPEHISRYVCASSGGVDQLFTLQAFANKPLIIGAAKEVPAHHAHPLVLGS